MIYRLTEREEMDGTKRDRESMRVRREETIKTFPRYGHQIYVSLERLEGNDSLDTS